MKKEETRGGELIHFPEAGAHAGKNREWEEAVFRILVAPMRTSSSLLEIAEKTRHEPEEVEALLRTSRCRSRVLACLEAYLVAQIPAAAARLCNALERDETWAFKLLLEAVGFERVAGGILEGQPEQSEVVISSSFEREFIERMLAFLRSQSPAPSSGQKDNEETEDA